MSEQVEIDSQDVIQNLVDKVAVKEYQLSQYEVFIKKLQKQLEELQKEGE